MRHHTMPLYTGTTLFFFLNQLHWYNQSARYKSNLLFRNWGHCIWNSLELCSNSPTSLAFLSFRHGVRQILSCWSDGPSYITQCPIQAGQSYTYEFTLVQQKGTLLWHAHVSWLRATVHGAIVIYPKTGVPYPFPFPYEEHIIVLGKQKRIN